MSVINYISNLAIPFIILIIVVSGVIEKVNVFDIFLEGAREGIEIVIKIFPTLVGLFVAIGALRNSGVLELIIKIINPITNILKVPTELVPLALLRPVSRKRSNCDRKRYYAKLWS